MGLTKNGSRIGMAQHVHLRDQRIWLEEKYTERVEQLKQSYGDALETLKELDPSGWRTWYDDDNNVPPFKGWVNCQPALDAITARIAQLQHNNIVAQEPAPVTR